jgi:hypothetical protein
MCIGRLGASLEPAEAVPCARDRCEDLRTRHGNPWHTSTVERNQKVAGRAAEVRRASRGLRQHARALHACYQYWRQRYLLVECTWCQKHLDWQYMDKPLVDLPPTSHGVCPTCFETQWREQRRRQP